MGPVLIIIGIVSVAAFIVYLAGDQFKKPVIIQPEADKTQKLTALNHTHTFFAPLFGCVPRFYVFDPEKESQLQSGYALQEGMKVLVDSFTLRVDVSKPVSLVKLERAMEMNRWCTIQEPYIEGGNINFYAVYDDGAKKHRSLSLHNSWVVKNDTIPFNFDQSEIKSPYASFAGETRGHHERFPEIFGKG